MANSTFSGPVRSQNGFQELVDGVWTPVGGGGGGGVTSITAGSGISVSAPTGAVTIDVAAIPVSLHTPITLNFTQIGQVFFVVNSASEYPSGSGYTINFTCPLDAPGNPVQFSGLYIGGNGPLGVFEYAGAGTLTLAPVKFFLQFVLAGVRNRGYGSGLEAFVQFTGYHVAEIL